MQRNQRQGFAETLHKARIESIMPRVMAALTVPERLVLRHLRHNLIFNVADGTFWLFGMAFVSTTTILPVYVSHLTDSAVVIGLAPALESLGWYLPQIIVAPFIEGLTRVKPFVVTVAFFERVLLLVIGLSIAAFPASAAGGSNFPLLVFFVILGIRMFVSGVNALPWQEMIARVIPARQRGSFFAAQRFFGGIAGLLGAAAAGATLSLVPYPLNYMLCFVFAFAASMLSWLAISRTIEPRQKIGVHREHISSYWRELPGILQHDRNLGMYLAARSLGNLGTMATAFFAVHAIHDLRLGDDQAAAFTAILLGSNIIGSAIWGWIGDKWGQKLVLVVSSLLFALALGAALLQDGVLAYYVVFMLTGTANAGLLISDLAVVLEFSPAERRPAYMGIARGWLGPWIGLAPLLGGVLLAVYGYDFLVVVSLILTVFGLILVAAGVKEPRYQNI